MNQDGSDRKTLSSAGGGISSDHVNDLPRAISLSLLDSENKIIQTELIFFVQSYDEAILCALEAFPEDLSPNTTKDNISLKYLFKGANGIASWIGLRATQRSANAWKGLLSNGSDIVEIGVFVNTTPAAIPISEPITGKYGRHILARFFPVSGLRWSDSNVQATTPVPPTYEQCLDYLLNHVIFTSRPTITREEMKRGLQLEIYDGKVYLPFEPSDYRQVVQRHAILPATPETVFFKVEYQG